LAPYRSDRTKQKRLSDKSSQTLPKTTASNRFLVVMGFSLLLTALSLLLLMLVVVVWEKWS
jgi:LPXTG-motif cell wall-anchored protein